MNRQNHKDERAAHAPADAVRTFICIEVPGSIKQRIENLQRALKDNGAQVSWVKPSNIHLTIKFLGDVPRSKMDAVVSATAQASASVNSFEIEVEGAGCFPSSKNPRVLWVGLSHLPEPLKRLHSNIESALVGEGFPREEKRFSPHLTIGRVRNPRNATRTAEDLIAAGFEPESFPATEIIIMRSELSPKGSIYAPQAIISLGNCG